MSEHGQEVEDYDHETQVLFANADNTKFQILPRRDSYSDTFLALQAKNGLVLRESVADAQATLDAYAARQQAYHADRDKRDAAKLLENRKIEQEKITLNNSAYAKHVKIAGVDAYTPQEWQLQTGILPSVKEAPVAER